VQLVPDVMTLSPLSAYNALAYDLAFSEQTPGTIILDVGTTSTDLIVAEAGRVWIRTFPIGGHQFTEALVSAFKLSYTKAEKLKREAEQSKHARHIFQAMRPVFADLAQDVQRSIGYYQSLHPDANLVRLIGLGSTFRLPGLRKYLKQQLQLDVYRMEQFKRVSVDGPRSAEFHAASLNMATAYGLALQGLGLNAIEANLMPGAVLREAMWHRKVKWFAIAAGITVAAGATMFLRPFWDSTAVAGATPDPIIRNVIGEATSLKNEAREVTGGDATDYRAAKLMEMLDGHDVYAHVIDDLSLMLEDADAKTGLPGTFRLEKLITKYKAPEVSTSKKSKSRSTPRDRGGGGKAGGMGRGEPGIAPPGSAGRGRGSSRGEDLLDTKLKPSKNPRIFIQVEVSTTQADPQKLLLTTLSKWLAENMEREGVPYKIVMGSSVTWKKLGEREIAAPDEPEKVSGQQGRPPARGGRGGRGSRGMVAPPSEVIITGAPQIAQGVQKERATRAQGVASLEQIAPLPAPPPEAEPGTKIVTFAVAWEVELVGDKNEEGE
jgi:type IV pilus assembly protein PilM